MNALIPCWPTLGLVGAMIAVTPLRAAATLEGPTRQGLSFAAGGIGTGEREALDARRAGYQLWVRVAARNSGAYLADSHVRIADESGRPVLDATLPGPWLLVGLRAGKYRVEVSYGGRRQSGRRASAMETIANGSSTSTCRPKSFRPARNRDGAAGGSSIEAMLACGSPGIRAREPRGAAAAARTRRASVTTASRIDASPTRTRAAAAPRSTRGR